MHLFTLANYMLPPPHSTYTHNAPSTLTLIVLISDLIPPCENRFEWISVFHHLAHSFGYLPLPVIVVNINNNNNSAHTHQRITQSGLQSFRKSDSRTISYNIVKVRFGALGALRMLFSLIFFVLVFAMDGFFCIIHLASAIDAHTHNFYFLFSQSLLVGFCCRHVGFQM